MYFSLTILSLHIFGFKDHVVKYSSVCFAGRLNSYWEQNNIPQQLTCGRWVASWLNYYQRNHYSMGKLNLTNLTR